MNQKKSKKLRKEARQFGLDAVSYNMWRPPKFQAVKNSAGHVLRYHKAVRGVPVTLDKNCERAVYKRIKELNK